MIHKLFLALTPDPDEAAPMLAERARQRRLHGFTGPDVRAEALHVSLYGLGAWDAAPGWLMDGVAAALDEVQTPSFLIEFDRVLSLGRGRGRHAVVLAGGERADGIRFLRRELDELLPRRLPRLRRPPPLETPHLTLLRDERIAPVAFIEPIRWRARELVLIDSLHGLGRHVRIGGRPLGAPGEQR